MSRRANILPLEAALPPLAVDPPRRPPVDWVTAFILVQLLCALALLVPALGSMRVVWRTAAFGASLGMLYFIPRRGPFHPSAGVLLAAQAIVVLSLFHPTTNTMLAGLAQTMLYAAIMAPVLWVGGCNVTLLTLKRVMMIMWGFGFLSAAAGVIQTYFPGTMQFPVSTAIQAQGEWYVEDLKIVLASGQRVFRPMGLTDLPGGAADGAASCILFSLVWLVIERRTLIKALAVAGVMVGMFCLYLCQVRVALVSTLICAITFAMLLLMRGETRRFVQIGSILAGGVFLGFAWAVAVGGDVVTSRIESLFADKPAEVYYSNRGRFLEETVTELLPKYPLGAGLARWGMMNFYFGDNSNPETASIWAEIQWTGWLLDGGVPLVLAYTAALVVAILTAARCALDRRVGTLSTIAAIVVAYDIGIVATTFNSCPFIGSGGVEFWVLNAAVYAVYRSTLAAQAARPGEVVA
jgi:hypothetical protein